MAYSYMLSYSIHIASYGNLYLIAISLVTNSGGVIVNKGHSKVKDNSNEAEGTKIKTAGPLEIVRLADA